MPGLLKFNPKLLGKQIGLLERTPVSSMANASISQAYSKERQRKQQLSLQRKSAEAPSEKPSRPLLSPEDVARLQADISQQFRIRSPEEAASVVPQPEVQEKLKGVLTGDKVQTKGGLLGGLGGAVLAGGLGAVTTGLAKGLEKAPSGLMMAIPGAFRGYRLGKKLVQNQEVKGLLADAYQDSPLRVEEFPKEAGSLDDLLEYLFPKKSLEREPIKATFPAKPLPEPKPSFLARQGTRTFRAKVRESSKPLLPKGDASQAPKQKQPSMSRSPKVFKPTKHYSLKEIVKKNPKSFAIMGGLAALGALGLTAAQIQKYRRQKSSSIPRMK